MASSVIEARRDASERRLERFRGSVVALPEAERAESLCIYVTGSYGRLEASAVSALDLFFLHVVDDPAARYSRIAEILLDAALIRLCDQLGFPEFSGDGEYLEIHNIAGMLNSLGSPDDDYHNYFTARLLLLLEGRPVHNEGLFDDARRRIVSSYFRDYQDHETAFHPLFLINDILRFWKTLCLNYEHRRNRLRTEDKPASHLKNLKQKFSRMLTCYSLIVSLAAAEDPVTPERVIELTAMAPMSRLSHVASTLELNEVFANLEGEYAWFLTETTRPKAEALEWISDRSVRDSAFEHARQFGASIYCLLDAATRRSATDLMRYIVI